MLTSGVSNYKPGILADFFDIASFDNIPTLPCVRRFMKLTFIMLARGKTRSITMYTSSSFLHKDIVKISRSTKYHVFFACSYAHSPTSFIALWLTVDFSRYRINRPKILLTIYAKLVNCFKDSANY